MKSLKILSVAVQPDLFHIGSGTVHNQIDQDIFEPPLLCSKCMKYIDVSSRRTVVMILPIGALTWFINNSLTPNDPCHHGDASTQEASIQQLRQAVVT